jgi:hypothetical protein
MQTAQKQIEPAGRTPEPALGEEGALVAGTDVEKVE